MAKAFCGQASQTGLCLNPSKTNFLQVTITMGKGSGALNMEMEPTA
jgi:hypothetical protein